MSIYRVPRCSYCGAQLDDDNEEAYMPSYDAAEYRKLKIDDNTGCTFCVSQRIAQLGAAWLLEASKQDNPASLLEQVETLVAVDALGWPSREDMGKRATALENDAAELRVRVAKQHARIEHLLAEIAKRDAVTA